jgi:predicted metal-dependent hydrolase
MPAHPKTPPKPRTPRIGFTASPRKWLAHSIVASHIVNGVNLLFPAGERFFVRSVYRYMDQIDDPDLRAQVKGFAGQEGRHANVHERYFEALRGHGYDIDSILEPYERIAYGIIEKRAPAALRLAATVACEHFTAILAEDALTDGVLEHADPALRNLLYWHAVEELEHKAVAFDVLRQVNPSYVLRMAGLFVATVLLGAFWLSATRKLLAQDGVSLLDARRELARIRKEGAKKGSDQVPREIVRDIFWRGIKDYLRPGFHPNDHDHSELVKTTLARLAREGVVDGENDSVDSFPASASRSAEEAAE